MRKTLVTYLSGTGNTKKVAEAIFEALDGDKTIKPINEVANVDGFGLVFVGFPVHAHSVPYKADAFIKKLPPSQKVAFFCTHGALSGHLLSRQGLEAAVMAASKCKVIGTYSCRGRVSAEVIEALKKSPENFEWIEMVSSADSHPNDIDLAEAKAFARQVVTTVVHTFGKETLRP
jgi:flavodoxin